MIRRQPARGAASIEGRAAPGALDVAHMLHAQWFLVLGALLALMAYLRHVIERLPVSTAMIYLAVGIALGPSFAGWLAFDPLQQRELLETAAEVAVLLSLFTAGIKLRVPLGRAAWRLPLQLAKLSMLATVVLVTLFGQLVLGLPTGLALLVAAVLAPTDPVLAADVQLRDPQDRDRLRLALTGEAAMNDGTAFPFVFLGLGLLGLHELGVGGSGWLVRDLLWGTLGGLGIGFVVGHLAAMAVLRGEIPPVRACLPVSSSFDLRYGDVSPDSEEARVYRFLLSERSQDADASPILFAKGCRTPFHLSWGSADLARIIRTSNAMATALRETGCPVSTAIMQGARHFDTHLWLSDLAHPWYACLRAAFGDTSKPSQGMIPSDGPD